MPDLPRLPPLKPTSAPKQMQKQDHGLCDGALSDQAEPQMVPRTERRHSRASSQPCWETQRVTVNPLLPGSVVAGVDLSIPSKLGLKS